MNERLRAVISGRVQLVMYRDFAMRKAIALGLVGEVRNIRDGTVVVIAEGPRATLERFVMYLQKGSVLSNVERVAVQWLPAGGEFTEFKIKHG